ncbi:MAG: acyl-CoA reductase, partial [Bacteroidetes bacterium]|nr:acyl-CoA reductase [Bacteroidota bacterium]
MGQVFSSKGTEWTVIYSEEKGLAEACYSRTIFVRPIDNLSDILDFIEHNKHQTLGLSIRECEKYKFAKEATKSGIERITELGKMSAFDYPWDGMFPINRYVRWVSLQ